MSQLTSLTLRTSQLIGLSVGKRNVHAPLYEANMYKREMSIIITCMPCYTEHLLARLTYFTMGNMALSAKSKFQHYIDGHHTGITIIGSGNVHQP